MLLASIANSHKGVGKGGVPDFKLMYYVYQQLPQKDVQNLLL